MLFINLPRVPVEAQLDSEKLRIWRKKWIVEVLPFVPVTAIILASVYVNECLEKHLIAGNNNDYNKESKEEVENDMEIDVEADIGNQQIISPTTYKANGWF